MAGNEIIISAGTADLCQQLVALELDKCKALNIYPKRLKTRLEVAKNELKGNHIDTIAISELLKRIKEYDRYRSTID